MANFEDIPSNITIGASQSVRRNAANNAFEAFTPLTGITIGQAISGGGANRVLYEDGSQNLATSANLTYASSVLTIDRPGNVTTVNNALGIRNTTPTNSGNGNEYSPAIEWEAHGRLESAGADKTGLFRSFLKTPYVASGATIRSHWVCQMDRGSVGSYNNIFEIISPAPQDATVSNAFRFYYLGGGGGLDLVVDTNNTASFYEQGTTNYVPFLGKSFGGHASYQAFDISTWTKPTLCALFNDPIVFRAGRVSDGAGASGSEKVDCQIPFSMADGKNFTFGTTTGNKVGQAGCKTGFFGANPVTQRTHLGGFIDNSGGDNTTTTFNDPGASYNQTYWKDFVAAVVKFMDTTSNHLQDLGLTA